VSRPRVEEWTVTDVWDAGRLRTFDSQAAAMAFAFEHCRTDVATTVTGPDGQAAYVIRWDHRMTVYGQRTLS